MDERIRWRPPRAGKASDYLKQFSIRYPGEPIVLACRVSERFQKHRGNDTDQAANLTAAVNATRGRVVATVCHVGPGTDPGWLTRAVVLAQRHGARLLAETTDRFVRNSLYHSRLFPDVRATEQDLWYLAFWLDGVEAMTLVHPDAAAAEVRSYQRKRGQAAKGKKGGRPANREPGLKSKWLRQMLKMHRDGASYREVSVATGVPVMSCYRWINGD